MNEIKTTVETITPEIAREYLKRNKVNRPLSKNTIAFYASAILKDQWTLNGEAIKFSSSGILLDGQHRLQAVINANKSINTMVMRGLDGSVFDTLDQGRTRSGGDILSLSGVVNGSVTASIISKYYYYQIGWVDSDGGSNLIILKKTKRDVLKEYNDYSEFWSTIASKAMQCYVKKRLFTKSDVGGYMAFLIRDRKHPQHVVFDFYEQLFDITPETNQTIKILRDKIVDASLSGFKMNASYKRALLIKTFNAYLTGRVYKSLYYNEANESYPEVL